MSFEIRARINPDGTVSTPPPEDDSGVPVVTLGPIRHQCHSSGMCCTGWSVQVSSLEDRKRVVEQAKELGIEDPLTAGDLRRVGGRCVFLREDNLCAIHARFGETQKPSICRHFPRRSRWTEDGIRVAADPGCSSNWRTFADGPEMEAWRPRTTRSLPLDGQLIDSERALITLARYRDMTVPLYIAALTNDHSHLPAPNPAFVKRLLTRMARTVPMIADDGHGPKVAAALAGVLEFLLQLDRTGVPEWQPLAPESEAFALDLLQRHLFLRIADETVPPVCHAMMVLAGVLLCAYVDRTPQVFGESMAAWSRVCRTARFWMPSMPDKAAGEWILHGKGDL